jgi:kumamolisin
MESWFMMVRSLLLHWMPPTRRAAGGKCVAFAVAFASTLALTSITRASLQPSQLLSGYGFNTVQQTYTGTGQTIAIYTDGYYSGLQADVNQFSTTYMSGVSTTVLATTTSGATPAGTDSPSAELALDVEYSHLLAPSATIMVVDSSSTTAAATYASTHGASVFSTSYAGYETNYTQADVQSYDAIYKTASANMAIFSAAGDSSHVDYPASSPYVIGVAGTNLTVSGTGAYSSETAWSSSGGGQSTLEAEPAFQLGVQSSGYRMTPDVSIAGGNNSAMPVIISGSTSYNYGSSIASPIWAGYMALIDQARLAHGYTALSSTAVLNLLYGSLQNNTYSTIFHDITTGSDSTSGLSAGPDYDELTGLGSPQAVAMLNALDDVAPEPAFLSLLFVPTVLLLRRRRRISPQVSV